MTNTSIVAIRVCTKCIKSNVNNNVVTVAIHVSLKNFLARLYRTGTINTPNNVPANLHPNGFMPNISTPHAIKTLPRGGCVFS